MSLALKLIGAGIISCSKGILILLSLLGQAVFHALMALAEFIAEIFSDVVGGILFFAMVFVIIATLMLLTAPALM